MGKWKIVRKWATKIDVHEAESGSRDVDVHEKTNGDANQEDCENGLTTRKEGTPDVSKQ